MATLRRPSVSRAQTTPTMGFSSTSLLTPLETHRAKTTHPRPPPLQFLMNYSSLQPWQQDNAYIITHYRPASYSYSKSFQSLFYLHNESVNIHSHLLGAFLFFFTGLSVGFIESYRLDLSDYLVFACFFGGAIVCLGISASFHLFSNHSAEVCRFGNQCDYVGIVALITGSFVPSVYYGFHCERGLKMGYWGMIMTAGVICTIVSINPKFRTPKWRTFRASMFVAMGLSAVFPVFHGVALYGVERMNQSIGLSWLVLQGFLYVLGAAIYAAQIPERLQPGRFDVWGSSHQIFHVLILLAAMAHLVGLLIAFHHAKTQSAC